MNTTRNDPPKTWFEDWFDSPFYHLLYHNRDQVEAQLFIENLLGYLQPPGQARMLDMACGRGRHALLLASKGFQVTGTDLSANNIAYAQKFGHQNLSFFVHDMRQPFLLDHFDYVFNFFTSFGYFTDPADNLKTIKSVYSELKQCGIFVVDFLNPAYVRAQYVPEETRVMGEVHFHIRRSITAGRIIKEITVEQSGQKFHFMENVALLEKRDFEQLFTAAGLQLQDVFGDYSLCPFDPEHSPRCILIAQKN